MDTAYAILHSRPATSAGAVERGWVGITAKLDPSGGGHPNGVYNPAVAEAARALAGDGLETRGGLLSDVLERLEHIEAEGLDISGFPTGLADLDRKLGGLQPSTLVVVLVASQPGMGKSALAMNNALHVAPTQSPVDYFSLERSPTEVADRWLAAQARASLCQRDPAKWLRGMGVVSGRSAWAAVSSPLRSRRPLGCQTNRGCRSAATRW